MGKVYMICGNVDIGRSVASTMANYESIIVVTPEQAKKMPLTHNRPHEVFEFTAPAILPSLNKPLSRRDRRKAERLNK